MPIKRGRIHIARVTISSEIISRVPTSRPTPPSKRLLRPCGLRSAPAALTVLARRSVDRSVHPIPTPSSLLRVGSVREYAFLVLDDTVSVRSSAAIPLPRSKRLQRPSRRLASGEMAGRPALVWGCQRVKTKLRPVLDLFIEDEVHAQVGGQAGRRARTASSHTAQCKADIRTTKTHTLCTKSSRVVSSESVS